MRAPRASGLPSRALRCGSERGPATPGAALAAAERLTRCRCSCLACVCVRTSCSLASPRDATPCATCCALWAPAPLTPPSRSLTHIGAPSSTALTVACCHRRALSRLRQQLSSLVVLAGGSHSCGDSPRLMPPSLYIYIYLFVDTGHRLLMLQGAQLCVPYGACMGERNQHVPLLPLARRTRQRGMTVRRAACRSAWSATRPVWWARGVTLAPINPLPGPPR